MDSTISSRRYCHCTHRGPSGCHGDCIGADETHSAEVILIDVHKGNARAGRYTTPTAPVDPWMQRRREPWRK